MESLRVSISREVRCLMRLGSPIFLGQLAQAGMGTVDTIMAGNFNTTDLAAISIGQSLWMPLLIFLVGLFYSTTTTVAHQNGANNQKAILMTTQQSVWMALLVSPLGLIPILNADVICEWLGVEQAVSLITVDYLYYLSFSLPALTSFLALRGFCDGQGKTRPIMMINIVAFICNIPLNYVFIYGLFGLPAMGGAGCGLASCIVIWVQLICIVCVIGNHHHLKLIGLFHHWSRPQLSELRQLLSLGVPIALTMLAEVALFSCVALIIAPLGTMVLAANQIAMSVGALTFMLPLSTGIAINIRSGNHLGAGNISSARFSCLVGIGLGMLLALCTLIAMITGRVAIASWYTEDSQVILLASGLLFFSAVYQLPDAVQVCVINALRSFKDTKMPLLFVLVAYWVISVPLGWCMTMGAAGFEPIGAKGMWIGLVCGLTFAAIVLSFRFRWLLKRYKKIESV